MLHKIRIKNFKSIVDMEMDLGRVNVVIGANGCGKTNILEALAFASAAIQQKLDNEYLLSSYLVFSPQMYVLRKQHIESHIQPIGLYGEGLFQYLEEQRLKGNEGLYEKLNEAVLQFSDCDDSLQNFDLRTCSEGFLFMLFYFTLFYSQDTPSFFGIDNLGACLNPKLGMHLMKELIRVAKENDKQVIMTTHNPFVLDALNLQDDEQRLFVARRDIDGHTRISRVPFHPERSEKLSSVWLNGYIGGLPDNF